MNPLFRPVGLGLVLLAAACGSADAEQQQIEAMKAQLADPGATRVELVTLQASDVSLRLDLPGEVVGSEDVLLGTAAGGYVESVRVERGEDVSKGQTLAVIDLAPRQAQLKQAEAQLDLLQQDLRRAEALGEFGAEARVATLRSQVASAQAGVDMARVQVARAVITAPFAGTIGERSVDAGEIAMPSAPVLRLVALDPVLVVLSVSDRDVVALQPGLPATVSTAAVGSFAPGVVKRVAPVADLSTRSFLVEVEVPNPDRRLLPGMIARVEVERPLGAEAVVVPQEWLVTKLDGYGAFVIEDGVARWREVALGELVRGQVVVSSGLAVGDRLVIAGQHDLVDGDAVIVAREGTCCVDGRPTF
jgi:membrane fusion protein (multidrug efflux system)